MRYGLRLVLVFWFVFGFRLFDSGLARDQILRSSSSRRLQIV